MTITTLNITPNKVKVLVTRGSVTNRHEIDLPPGTLRNGFILQPDIVAEQLKSLFLSAKIPRENVICSINGLPFSYRLLNIPKMAPPDFDEAVLRAVKKEMPISPDEMYLSWQVYPAENNEWQVMVAGITRQPVDNLIKALSVAGISPYFLDLPHLALARLVQQDNAVIIDLEKDCSNIVMLVDGVPRGMHMVPSAGGGASLQDEVGQVADKLAKMIDFYNGNHPGKPIKETEKIIVTGAMLDDENTIELLRQQLEYPVELLAAPNDSLSVLPLHDFAVNAGSELLSTIPVKDTVKGFIPHRPLNLGKIVRDNRPKTDVGKSVRKVMVTFTLVAGIGVLVFSYFTQNQAQASISGLEADFNRANAALAQRQALVGQAKITEDNIGEIESRIQGIKIQNQTILDPEEYVNDISSIIDNMPEGLTFSTIEIDSNVIIVFGSTYEASYVVQFTRNLEASGNFYQANISRIDRPKVSGNNSPPLSFQVNIYK